MSTQEIINSLSAGAVAGIRTILGSAAMVTLLLPPTLAAGVPRGLDMMLIGGAVLAAAVAALSSYRGVVAQVQDGPVVILGVMIASITLALGPERGELAIQVALVSVSVAALAAGLIFFSLGARGWGGLVRYIPYPVIGGFLAGSGFLILRGSLPVLLGIDLAHMHMTSFWEATRMLNWLPGVLFGVTLMLLMRRFNHVLLVPGVLLGGVLLFHLSLAMRGISIEQAQAAGWLLGPFPANAGIAPPAWFTLPQEGWSIILAHLPTFGAIVLMSVVTLLLNASGLEMATHKELDINRELRATGLANLLSAACGGPVGFHALSASLLGHRMRADGRLIGLTCAAVCALALVAGTGLVGYFPKAVLGGLLLSMGGGLMIEWLYDGWRRLPHQDYTIVLLIVLVMGGVGVIAGVIAGVMVAMVIFVLNYSRMRVIRQELSGADYHSNVERSPMVLSYLKEQGQAIRILKLESFIFFGTAYSVQAHIQGLLRARGPVPLRFLLVDFQEVRALDSSATAVFSKIQHFCRARGAELIFTRMNAEMARQFSEGSRLDGEAAIRMFPDLDVALEYCEEKLLQEFDEARTERRESIWDQIAAALPAGTSIEGFKRYLEPREFAPGDYLMHQGMPSEEILFIESGRITIHLKLDDGRSVRLRSMHSGTTIGEIGMYLNQPRTASAVADLPTRAHVLSVVRLREMEIRDPALAHALHYVTVALLSARLAGTNSLVQRLMT
jgi:SulP family sulfate permease